MYTAFASQIFVWVLISQIVGSAPSLYSWKLLLLMTKLGGRMVINKYQRSIYPPKAAYFSAESTFMQIMFPALQIDQVTVTGSISCSLLPLETWCTETVPLEVHATRDLVLATKAE
jgi:hypothetical protein